MRYEIQKYSFGKTIGKGFNLYISNIVYLLLFSAVCHLPVIIIYINYVLNPGKASSAYYDLFQNEIFYYFYMGFILYLVSALYSYILSKKYLAKKIYFNEIIIWIIGKIIPLSIICIITIITSMIGYIFFVTPGLIIAIGLSVTPHVFINEKMGIFKSLKRSWQLTRDFKWNIFTYVIFLSLIILTAQGLFFLLVQVIPINMVYQDLISILSFTVLVPLMTGAMTIEYFNIRIEKEAYNVEHLAQQFEEINSTT